MRRIETVYLAGPDRWFPDPEPHLARMRALCEAAGFRPLGLGDVVTAESEPSEALARELYAEAAARLRRCDAVIANLTPWRGAGADPATAFEAGFAAGLGRPVFAYLNVANEDEAELLERVGAVMGASPDPLGVWRDGLGCAIEDLGLPESALLWAEARRFLVVVTADPLEDLTGLKACLEAVTLYAE